MRFLGIDTSNYTTSVALYDDETRLVSGKKKLLEVKKGEKGLRQSEALFHHTVNLPELFEELFAGSSCCISAVGASSTPRTVEGSYMPCFLPGKTVARCLADATETPFYSTSHQHGHIAAAIYSSGRNELFQSKFIALHLSGGTTEALLVEPDEKEIFKIKLIAESLDLKAGQLIDRTGVLLGLKFPCGAELDKLSDNNTSDFKIKPTLKGHNCCLSGIENQIVSLREKGFPDEYIADYCIQSVIKTVEAMTDSLLSEYGDLPLLFAGGVSSNSKLQKLFRNKYNASFASPEYSTDNAAGVAIITAKKYYNDHFDR